MTLSRVFAPFSTVEVNRHDLGKQDIVILAALAIVTYVLSQFVLSTYRLFFHPLAKFPGPRAACLSDKWAFSIGKKGFPEKDFEDLHKKYATTTLRIRPNEVHISDVHQYKVIYSQKATFLKEAPFYDGFNTPHTLFAETDPTLHKERRRLLNNLFSRAGVLKLEPIIKHEIDVMIAKCYRLCKTQDINVYEAFRCLTTDVISEFAFGRSSGLLEESQDSFRASFLGAFDTASNSISDLQYRPMLRRLTTIIPKPVIKKLSPEVGFLLDLHGYAESSLRHFQKLGNVTDHPVVFENLEHLSDKDQVNESMDILIAGADTTASTLTTAILNILQNPKIENKLVDAIHKAFPNKQDITLMGLEKIEYLNACLKEALRIGMAVPGRLPRVVPGGGADPFIVDGKLIPPGTIVSMSAYTMHTSEEIWGPDARKYVPERWLAVEAKSLEQYLCTFSKGARMCIGINVAYAEATLVLGHLFSNFKLGLTPGYIAPATRDVFTLSYLEPGLSLNFSPLSSPMT